jgi:hypothetical protein
MIDGYTKAAIVVTASLYGLTSPVSAAPPTTQPMVQIRILPECKKMFYGPDWQDFYPNDRRKKMKRPDFQPWDPGRAKAMTYRDPRTSILFYVESDGRHLGAIDLNGRLLWVRNPYEDKPAFCQYRTPRPIIGFIGPAELSANMAGILTSWGGQPDHTFLEIKFDSSQFGILDETTGDFFPEGQN